MRQAKKNRDLIVFFDHLAQSSQAGIPIVEVMNQSAGFVDTGAIRRATLDMAAHVEQGHSLGSAFNRHPKLFSPPLRALIYAGEQTGRMQDAFARCRDHMKWREEYRAKIVKMLRYPVIVTVLIALLSLVSGGQSSILSFLLLAILVWGTIKLRRTWPDFKDFTDCWALKLPAFGLWLKNLALARFAGIFATLYKAGLKPDQIMEISISSADNLEIKRVLQDVRLYLKNGDSLYDAFSKTRFFPPSFMRAIRSGEQSGRLDLALEEQALSFDQDVTRSLDLLFKTLPPVITIILGFLLFLALS